MSWIDMKDKWRCTNFVFFFQAEDGIRDHCVTGVQTCALPIFRRVQMRNANRIDDLGLLFGTIGDLQAIDALLVAATERDAVGRSEERRVGKECRSRWLWYSVIKEHWTKMSLG